MPAPASESEQRNDGIDPDALLSTIASVAREVHPHLRDRDISLDISLDRDLGLDSLARVEVLSRVEHAFGVSVPESELANAETPRDVLRALRTAAPEGAARSRAAPAPAPASEEFAEAAPREATTLVDVALWHAAEHGDRVHVHLHGEDGGVEPITYTRLLDRARRLAAGLRGAGAEPGDAIAIMLPTGADYLAAFLAVQLAGGVPVPIYPPARIAQIEDHVRRHARILANAGTRVLVTFPEARNVSRLLTSQVQGLRRVAVPGDLLGDQRLDEPAPLGPDDVAFLQYTSGSTGNPKGVVLTHANVLASLRSMREALDARSRDVFVSWLPLYHDMGLIGAWMGSLVYAFPLVLMSPLAFLSRPVRWLRAIHDSGGTLSGGPNFAFELCVRRIRDEELEGLDLSSWRLAFNGAEPVSPETLDRFAERFAPHGLRREALTPVYGLAEATLGVAFTPRDRGPRVDAVRREPMTREARAEPAEDEGEDTVRFVSSGVPIPGFEVRVIDDTGHEAPDRIEGAIEFRGPSTTSGYYRNPEATRALFHDDWLASGDRGYVADGELYVTGRTKDVIIRAGRNIYPYELEQTIGEVEGVRRGCVAAFAAADASGGTENLVVVAETRESGDETHVRMREEIDALTHELLGMPADDVVLAPPHTVLKTSSGKIRRAALRERYERGSLIRPAGRAVWLQLARLGAASAAGQARRLRRLAAEYAFAARAWIALALVVAIAWPAVVLAPDRHAAARRVARAGRALLRACGIRCRVSGAETIPEDGSFVLVANHSSYLDGLVLEALLPAHPRWVVKGELRENRFAGLFLERLGACFVERFDRTRGLEDSRALTAALAGGDALGFFPEGTLHRMPGLLPFHLGAFAAAASAGAPVVPVTVRGTRSILRGDSLFPRRGTVRVDVGEPIPAPPEQAGSEWERAVALRDRARAEILRRCGEPDLADRNVMPDLADEAAARRERRG